MTNTTLLSLSLFSTHHPQTKPFRSFPNRQGRLINTEACQPDGASNQQSESCSVLVLLASPSLGAKRRNARLLAEAAAAIMFARSSFCSQQRISYHISISSIDKISTGYPCCNQIDGTKIFAWWVIASFQTLLA